MKQVLGKICKHLPSIEDKCQEFVDTYGDAIVAILAQEIDASQVNIFLYFGAQNLVKYNLTFNRFRCVL